MAAAGYGAGVPAAVLTVATGRATAGHMASLEARLGLSDDDFSGLSSGCEDDFSGDDQSDDNFNGGGDAVAGAQPVLAVVDIVHDEPAGRERHRHRGVSPVVGAVQEICAHGAVLHMLHVRGADGMDVDIGLAPIAKDTLYVPPLAATLAGRCFLNPSSASNAVTWCPSFCEAPSESHPVEVLAVDTDALNAQHMDDGITMIRTRRTACSGATTHVPRVSSVPLGYARVKHTAWHPEPR